MKRIKILHAAAKTPREADPRRSAVGRQVTIDCTHLPVPYTDTGNAIYHRGSDCGSGWISGGSVAGR